MEAALRGRTASKVWVSRLAKNLREHLDLETTENLDLNFIRSKMKSLNEKLVEYKKAQESVEALVEESKLEAEIGQAIDYLDTIEPILSKCETILNNEETDNHSLNSMNKPQAKLPKLDLPVFTGDVIQWNSFWDQFNAVIDDSDMPPVAKFSYLRSLLKGEALTSVKGLSITAKSYEDARDILVKRYGRPERIIFSHLQTLLQMDSVTSSKSADLWALHDNLTAHIKSLEGLGVGGKDYGVVLTPLILSRLPQEIRMEWARDSEGKEGNLEFLMSFLFAEIQRRERSQAFTSQESKLSGPRTYNTSKSNVPQNRNKNAERLPSATSLYSSSSNECVFCDGSHPSWKCYSVHQMSLTERKRKLREKRVCFVCLNPSHWSLQCKKQCNKCRGKHHSLVCPKVNCETQNGSQRNVSEQTETKVVANTTGTVSHIGMTLSTRDVNTVLQTIRVNIKGFPIHVLFDSGSDRSYMSSALVKKLKPEFVTSEQISYTSFGKNEFGQKREHKLFKVHVMGQPLVVTEIKDICTPLLRPKVPNEHLEAFGDIEFVTEYGRDETITIDLLIGLDYYHSLLCDERVQIQGLLAQKTMFGWMLSGAWTGSETKGGSCQLLSINQWGIDTDLSKLWDLELLGIQSNENEMGPHDKIWASFNESIMHNGERYVVALPWKEGFKQKLLNNYNLALKRLNSLEKRLSHNELKVRYDDAFDEMEKYGFIKEVSEEELSSQCDNPIFYLPHRPVIREQSSSTKIRPVFDASAGGYNGISLNHCMNAGPNLLPNLVDILIRFRRWPFALTSDITKAFLQICVIREDQDVHRFLWRKGGVVRVMRFDRVPFGNKCSPFLLNATIKHHLEKRQPSRVVEELNENIYVDDWLSGADSKKELFEMKNDAIDIMNEAGMPLAKWSSNTNLNSEEMDGKNIELKGAEDADSDISRVLGLKWLTGLDSFSYEGISVPTSLKITKRVVLSLMARLFDPLGFLAPFSILAKMIFQELWKLRCDWDEIIPSNLENQFSRWISGLSVLHSWKVQRCFVQLSWSRLKALQIHVFCDASEKGYGACVYLKVLESDGSHTVSLVTAKGKVAPIKTLSIPRLELLAALIGARLLSQVRKSLKVSKNADYYCWSDSQVVLHWIRDEPWKWKTFVANRVSEIQSLTGSDKWFHCPGKDNPADLLSRGMHAEDLVASQLWLKGPVWLTFDIQTPKEDESNGSHMPETLLEAKGTPDLTSLLSAQQDGMDSFFDIGRHSSLTKAVRVFGWILRFVTNIKSRTKICGDLSFDELSVAKVELLRMCQEKAFPTELKCLREGKLLSKKSAVAKLSPFLDKDGLLRMQGRLHFSQLTLDEKFPIIIPKGELATLIVRFQHKLLKHAGVSMMMSSLRNTYWIIGVRKIAKRVKRECVPCQRMDKSLGEQVVAPLPGDRIIQSPPFSVTGLDYAGPLYCADYGQKKFYVLLFTCAVIRAIHLELVESLSLADFLCAFRRFVARRGLPNTIYSDNARTFQGAKSQLLKLFSTKCPEWKFIAPRSPWWGGWWERLVRSVKSSLKKSVGTLSLIKTELETCLHEVEACVNSRPLTFVGGDVDSQTPLTPSHFLLCRSSVWEKSDETSLHSPFIQSSEQILSLEIARSSLLERFWTMWMKDYLRNLRQVSSAKAKSSLQIGSVVLMKVEGSSRLSWPLGVIRKVFPGRDGVIRTVELETAKGTFCRSVQTLVHLELANDLEELAVIDDTPGHDRPYFLERDLTNVQSEISTPRVETRSGRQSKPVRRLDL